MSRWAKAEAKEAQKKANKVGAKEAADKAAAKEVMKEATKEERKVRERSLTFCICYGASTAAAPKVNDSATKAAAREEREVSRWAKTVAKVAQFYDNMVGANEAADKAAAKEVTKEAMKEECKVRERSLTFCICCGASTVLPPRPLQGRRGRCPVGPRQRQKRHRRRPTR